MYELLTCWLPAGAGRPASAASAEIEAARSAACTGSTAPCCPLMTSARAASATLAAAAAFRALASSGSAPKLWRDRAPLRHSDASDGVVLPDRESCKSVKWLEVARNHRKFAPSQETQVKILQVVRCAPHCASRLWRGWGYPGVPSRAVTAVPVARARTAAARSARPLAHPAPPVGRTWWQPHQRPTPIDRRQAVAGSSPASLQLHTSCGALLHQQRHMTVGYVQGR